MWPDRRLCDLFDIEHPIIQAPMTGTCTPALAGAVANAGALGSLGCAGKSVETIRREVGGITDRTNRAFNLNFFATDVPRSPAAPTTCTGRSTSNWIGCATSCVSGTSATLATNWCTPSAPME